MFYSRLEEESTLGVMPDTDPVSSQIMCTAYAVLFVLDFRCLCSA